MKYNKEMREGKLFGTEHSNCGRTPRCLQVLKGEIPLTQQDLIELWRMWHTAQDYILAHKHMTLPLFITWLTEEEAEVSW